MVALWQNHNDESSPNPVWAVRGLPGVAMALIALAMFVFKTANSHGFCLGGALGLLLGYCIFSFQIKRVVLTETPQPSDVNRYPIT